MWYFVLFDLPVVSKAQRKRATQFRKFLLDDGYIMMQYSVYARPCNGPETVTKHAARLLDNLPTEGQVRSMQITDAQYQRMSIFVGKKTEKEEKGGPLQLSLF
jgi:CRISPR-associated protein Cas2